MVVPVEVRLVVALIVLVVEVVAVVLALAARQEHLQMVA
jgi:hypothetical protein